PTTVPLHSCLLDHPVSPPCLYSYPHAAAIRLLSFQHPLPPRDLHSFPTRRSSDLRRRPVLVDDLGEIGVGESVRVLGHSHRRRRSEEHTSELQSRFDLVCRLLLEKKKKEDA